MTGGSRDEALERLGAGVFDLLVIGGGIAGCRTAYEAARAGLRVALVDAGDFAGATSGSSARLVHGGLRYLGRGDLRLVRAASVERNILCSRVAPHLMHPLPFVAATGKEIFRGTGIMAGLSLYAAVGGRGWPRPRAIAGQQAGRLVPRIQDSAVVPRAVFHEARTDDGRLTLATVKAARGAGAVVANYLRVVDLAVIPEGVSEAIMSGPEGELRARFRAVVNATGPWMDALRRLEDPRAEPATRLSKGVHVVLRSREAWRAAVAVSFRDGGHLYAIPHDDMVLVGTTDDEYAEEPGRVGPEAVDIARVLERASAFLPDDMLRPGAVASAYAGLRVLPLGAGATISAGRDHLLSVGPGGMVSVAGGKLTTHRRIAIDALRLLPSHVRPRNPRACDAPLPGSLPANVRARPDPENPVLRHLSRVYGHEAAMVLSRAARLPGGLERISPQGPDVWAQVHHAVAEEWALTVEDVVRRRTTLALRGLDTPEVRAGISAAISAPDRSPLPSGRTA
ncbi:FAD-dependent oxidoreductase [Rubrobacter tropicus]|uniref:FAD-dependent oxidoreductase n=1 Tax=Rubrobacter tropicus TaxID=2653851 RepID=A0A6G8Q8U8_9ACTN|nr:glycerol-3-phosphate dehydrogenase/oxidase [Rubrobacter tropicus]QIN82737.1 FAD-dependent oxidoreductase [Rubrobacter tropicus]